ncbi:MAG: YraN family protein [Patescibacteria group bacterium]
MDKPDHLRIGQMGEELVCLYLRRRGYRIIERNYLRKWGEIDIVAEKEGTVHFVEVKSVSRETLPTEEMLRRGEGGYNPAENMHRSKLERQRRVIETYLLDRFRDQEPSWQVDLASVYLSLSLRKAKVDLLEDIDL